MLLQSAQRLMRVLPRRGAVTIILFNPACFTDISEGGASPDDAEESTGAGTPETPSTSGPLGSTVGAESGGPASTDPASTGPDGDAGASESSGSSGSSSTTGGGDSLWDQGCASAAIAAACEVPVAEDSSCAAGPTAVDAGAGCGNLAEFRVPLVLDRSGGYVVGLIDPTEAVALPDTTLTIVGQDPKDRPLTCFHHGGNTPGPIAEVSLDAASYDLVVTNDLPGAYFPVVVRHVDTLCEVPEACCGTGSPKQCPEEGLRACVGSLDSYCAEEQWDVRCVDLAVAACGAACSVGG